MDPFRRTDRPQMVSCLREDVQCNVPSDLSVHGNDAFDKHVHDEAFIGSPEIEVTRVVEEGNIVMAEGRVRTQRKDGVWVELAFCDVFEMRGGAISRLTSYLVPSPEAD